MAVPLHEIFSSTAELYSSLPLPRRCIRVIELQGLQCGEQPDTTPLECILKVVNLDERPFLSYVWGEETSSVFVIKCGTVNVPISSSLHAALIQMRQLFGSISIWADAICINQEDEEDKDRQILLMQDIFPFAHTVYVWLGTGTIGTDSAMDWIEFMAPFIHGYPHNVLQAYWKNLRMFHSEYLLTRYRLWLQYRWKTLLLREPKSNHPHIRLHKNNDKPDFHDLLGRPWIFRAWTYQEILLAKNPVVICGSRTFGWDVLLRGLVAVYRCGQSYEGKLSYLFYNFHRPGLIEQLTAQQLRRLETPQLDVETVLRWVGLYEQWLSLHIRALEVPVDPYKWVYRTLQALIPLFHGGFISCMEFLWVVVNQPSWQKGLVFTYIILLTFIWIIPVCLSIFYERPYFLDLSFAGRHSRLLKRQNQAIGVLSALRTREANSPVDKSYSLYGILGDNGVLLTHPSPGTSVEEVYKDLFQDLIHHDSSYESMLMDYCHTQKLQPGSWVADWRNIAARKWVSRLYSHHNYDDTCAADSERGLFQVSKEDNTLNVFGIHPKGARVIWTSNEPSLEQTEDPNRNKTAPEVLLIVWVLKLYSCARTPLREKCFLESVFEVLEGTEVDIDDTAIWRRLKRFSHWHTEVFLSRLDKIIDDSGLSVQSDHDAPKSHPEEVRNDVATSTPEAGYSEEVIANLTTTRSLCLFETSEGRYMGTAPCSIAPGDILTLISGIEAPMVLRPIPSGLNDMENRYYVVGPALVPGFMKGEQWPWTKEKRAPLKSELTKFVLV